MIETRHSSDETDDGKKCTEHSRRTQRKFIESTRALEQPRPENGKKKCFYYYYYYYYYYCYYYYYYYYYYYNQTKHTNPLR